MEELVRKHEAEATDALQALAVAESQTHQVLLCLTLMHVYTTAMQHWHHTGLHVHVQAFLCPVQVIT